MFISHRSILLLCVIISPLNYKTVLPLLHWMTRAALPCVIQVFASQCLTALCASAGGGDGCTVAEQPEIDVLLNALLSPCFSVRDAALRVSPGRLILIFVEPPSNKSVYSADL